MATSTDQLTSRELQVIALVAEGFMNERFLVSEETCTGLVKGISDVRSRALIIAAVDARSEQLEKAARGDA